MQSPIKPRWQQVTALVSLSASGAITGFSFVPQAAAELKSPSGVPVHLLALEQSARPAPADRAMLRSAIVNVTEYFLRVAASKAPAAMEAIIWQHDSVDGVDHGPSCAAFASLTLELASQAVGQRSWVTGGTSYPWPLHKWADARVDPNPASPGIVSVLQDAQAHHRWHPVGDGYHPLPGDWVMFDGHVEVVTAYADGILHTVGGDSLPNFSVNAHEYRDPLGGQGVVGFVNNGELAGAAAKTPHSIAPRPAGHRKRVRPDGGLAAIPGVPEDTPPPARPSSGSSGRPASPTAAPSRAGGSPLPTRATRPSSPLAHAVAASAPGASIPGADVPAPSALARRAVPGTADIPGLPPMAQNEPAGPEPAQHAHYGRHHPSPQAPAAPKMSVQQTFIDQVAPGAVATQRRFGVPASVTIAQAIDESGWGHSYLATQDHNLFGIKGTGPAGSDLQPAQEYQSGQLVTRTSAFRVYRNAAESIADHGRLLATSGYYQRAMALRHDPNAFAASLTGVYATDPGYGAKLIDLMRRYDLYRYDNAAPVARPHQPARPGGASIPGLPTAAPAPPGNTPPMQAAHVPQPRTGQNQADARHQAGGPQRSGAERRAGEHKRPEGRAGASAPQPGLEAARASQPAPTPPGPEAALSSQPAPTPPVPTRPVPASIGARPRLAASRPAQTRAKRYREQLPQSVRSAFFVSARQPLLREEPLYRDVSSQRGIRWELLAACDWMQCEARPRYSPVHGEKLGTVNRDGTIYRTKSEALDRCACDLVKLARAVYGIDLTARGALSIRDLANAFAAFRWGALLKLHRTSAMEFPYSVAGLTDQHTNMRWPKIDETNTPDKPGGRFRMPFGAVPAMLLLDYPATA